MKWIVIVVAAIIVSWNYFISDNWQEYGAGVLVPEQPVQRDMSRQRVFAFKGYSIEPLAEFEMHARLLAKKAYSRDRGSDLSPIDMALGWGRMSDEAVTSKIDISQSGRWYRWRTEQPPIPLREISQSSANMHMIPASADIENAMKNASPGDLISLSGQLVRVSSTDGWKWTSSLTRNDKGANSCELVWVDRFAVVDPGALM